MIERTMRIAVVVVFGFIALAASLDLAARLDEAWRGFPATLGRGGYLLVVVAVVAAVAVIVAFALLGSRPSRRTAILVAGMALLLAVRLGTDLLISGPLNYDWRRYHDVAVTIANGGPWFGERPSGLPLLLSVPYRLFGPDPGFAVALNLVAGLLCGLCLFLIGERVFGTAAGAVALALYALAPAQALMGTLVASEVLYGAMLAAAVLALLVAWSRRDSPGLVALVAAGVVLGLSQYVRSTSVALLPAFLLAPLVLGVGWRGLIRPAIPLVLAFLVVLLPVISWQWTERGQLSVNTSTQPNWSLLVGMNQEHDGRWNTDDFALVDGQPGTPEAERIAGDEAWRRITSDPLGSAALALRKFPVTWGDEHYGARWAVFMAPDPNPRVVATLVLLSQASWAVTAVLAALGMAMTLGRDRGRARSAFPALLGLMVVTVAVIHLALESNPRYHAYFVPLFGIAAAGALVGRSAREPGQGALGS